MFLVFLLLHWQFLFLIGVYDFDIYHYLCRLANNFLAFFVIAIGLSLVEIGQSLQQLLKKEISLKIVASKNNNLNKENTGLCSKLNRL